MSSEVSNSLCESNFVTLFDKVMTFQHRHLSGDFGNVCEDER